MAASPVPGGMEMGSARPFPTFRSLLDELNDEDRAVFVQALSLGEVGAADRDWPSWAHDGQQPPDTDWSTCVVMGGRSFGKTRTGSEWIVGLLKGPDGKSPRNPLRIALVGATLAEARSVMVEGRSGLLEVAGPWIREWQPSLGVLRFRTGAEARLFSGHSPELLRGPEHHYAWCDELAKWKKAGKTWDMLQLGLRVGTRPRALVTTTPRPGPVLRRIMAEPGCVTIGGPTDANPHNSPAWTRSMRERYAGTRLGRQELGGELLTDSPGALWTPELLEKCRLGGEANCVIARTPDVVRGPRQSSAESVTSAEAGLLRSARNDEYVRIMIGVDPPTGDGTCGIIACAKDSAGLGHVLADHSVTARSPEGWARAVAGAAAMWGRLHANVPVTIVAEANQGGKMVTAVLRTADPGLHVRPVTAFQGKTVRAEPVAHLFEAGKILLHDRFRELEAELLGMIAGGDYEGPGTSPDRADAMVWALTELMLGKERGGPRIIRL
jgi:phage terminase large subunit-like protein